MQHKYFVGIDVGLDGAIVVMDSSYKVVDVSRMPTLTKPGNPTVKLKIDAEALGNQILVALAEAYAAGIQAMKFETASGLGMQYSAWVKPKDVCVFIEEPPSFVSGHMIMPQVSLTHSCGIVEGVVSTLGIKPYFVPVHKWKKQYDIKKGRTQKQQAIKIATQLNPELGDLKVKDADVAEAALVARYGMRYIIGVSETSEVVF